MLVVTLCEEKTHVCGFADTLFSTSRMKNDEQIIPYNKTPHQTNYISLLHGETTALSRAHSSETIMHPIVIISALHNSLQ